MKKRLGVILMFAVLFSMLIACGNIQQGQIKTTGMPHLDDDSLLRGDSIRGGHPEMPPYWVDFTIKPTDDVMSHKMEHNLEALFTELNRAFEKQETPDLSRLSMTDDAKRDVLALWNVSRIRIIHTENIHNALHLGGHVGAMQVRGIEVYLWSVHGNFKEHQEIVCNFDSDGNIFSFNIAIEHNQYVGVFDDGSKVTNERHRQMILFWMEQLRTAYEREDMEFLEEVYSDDALIITGRVMKRESVDGMFREKVDLTTQTKRQYLDKLRRIFALNTKIIVKFDSIAAIRHPDPKLSQKYYAVELHQKWNSCTQGYSDDGVLFLIWDFSDEDHPRINVRAWSKQRMFSFDDFPINR